MIVGQLFCSAGYNVVLFDTVASQLTNAMESIEKQLQQLEEQGLMKGHVKAASEAFKLVTSCDNLEEALNGVFYVQECIPENIDLKKKVFSNLDQNVTNKDIILASSSSCIVPSKFTEELTHRNRCLVAHPVNPPNYIPLVEVVPAPWTDSSVVEQTVSLLKDIGQSPVVVRKEVNGFILNRLQYAVIAEAWRLVEDGVCSAQDVDTAFTEGLGLRYSLIGPLETMHLNANGIRDYCDRYGANIEKVCQEQGGPRPLTGATLDRLEEDFNRVVPLDKLDERRKWRDERLAALMVHKMEQQKKEEEKK
ncbi:hypothetical protein QZH41_008805 [Actinostola sp. cb2023]|nr:hypothetical protein QZH41_008805 [Actinostola sp. cb2023]